MPLIPERLIDEVQVRADIVDLIGRYVPLKRAGQHYKANCPFHKERTPSFMVNTQKQIFHCFGCGVGGNIFSFLMQHDRLTFPEAVRQLADQVGVHLPEQGNDERGEQTAALYALLDKVSRYFERWLAEPTRGRAARAYLDSRGVTPATQERFRLGLAPAGWNHLLKAATAAGVGTAQLEAAGLTVKGRTSQYDRFRNRLIFPILDARNRVTAFGGRSLDGQEPKYLNSPETAVYSKSRQLFGLAQAKDALLKRRAAIIVEGYFDCLLLAQGGFEHVVAPLGTALTAEQARVLRRYADQVILAFDPDAAGEQATLRGVDLLVEAGLEVRVAQLPAGADPDDCLRALGPERFQQLLDRSLGLLDFLIQTARRRHPRRGMEERVRAAQFVLPTIAKIPGAILRQECVRRVAEELDVDEAAVAEELRKTRPRGASPERAAPPGPARSTAPGPERLLVALVLEEPSRWDRAGLALSDIGDPLLRRILAVVGELRAGGVVTPALVVSRVHEDGLEATVSWLVELAQATEEPDAAFTDCVQRLAAMARRRDQAQLREQIRAAQAAGREVEVQRLLGLYQQTLTDRRTAAAGLNA